MYYCYQIISSNGNIEHTSKLFTSLEAAVEYFMNEDAPNHYAKMKFKPSATATGTYISSGAEYILVRFAETELKPVLYSEWSDLLHRKKLK